MANTAPPGCGGREHVAREFIGQSRAAVDDFNESLARHRARGVARLRHFVDHLHAVTTQADAHPLDQVWSGEQLLDALRQ